MVGLCVQQRRPGLISELPARLGGMNGPPSTSWTEISTFRQCPHKHALTYKERWQPPRLSRPLQIGLLWHEILDLHYRGIVEDGAPRIEAIIALLNEYGAKVEDHPLYPIGSTCLWMYHGYRAWAQRWDGEWTIREVETEFSVPLPDAPFLLNGRIDLLIEYKRHLWVVDHKAVKDLPYGKELDLDDQTPLYIWAKRQDGYDIRGAFLSHCRTQRLKRPMTEEERFSRDMVIRTDYELETVVQEAIASTRSAYHPDQTSPRHPDTHMCKWRCDFLEACIGGRKAAHLEQEILIATGFTRRERNRQLRLVPGDGT